MWIFAAVILISIGGSLGYIEVRCYKSMEDACNPDESTLPDALPQTAEELAAVCTILKDYGTCSLNFVVENCKDEKSGIKQMKKENEFLQETLCNPDSQLYKAISGNIECVIPTSEMALLTCNPERLSYDVMKLVASFKESLAERGFQENLIDRCMDFMYKGTCITSKVGDKCGSDSKEAMLKLVGYMFFESEDCESFVPEFPAFMESMELLETGEDILESLKKKK